MTLTTLRRPHGSLGDAALHLMQRWGWDVLPGTRLVRVGREVRCSCRRSGCTEPGRHPARRTEPRQAVLDWWDRFPDTPVLLATGRTFDVIDVPVDGGMRALHRLERMGAQLGPVARTPGGRLLFWVAPGAAAVLPDLLARLGWPDPADLDLRCHGIDGYVPAPPSPLGADGAVTWVRSPEASGRPPEARVLLGTLGRACHTGCVRSAGALGEPLDPWRWA